METTEIDWSRVNMKEELRGLSNEKKVERMRLVKIIMENNIKMLEIQKTIESIKRQREGEIRKKEGKRAREEEEDKERIVTEVLLDSRATELVISEEFVRRHKFKRTKLERPVYMRNINSTLNSVGPIVDTVEVKIFFKGIRKEH